MSFEELSYFKEASINDSKLLFKWSNDIQVRNNSINSERILFKDHKIWLNSKIKEKHSFIWIYFLKKNEPCGLVRFENKSKKYFISYLVDSTYRGKKISKKMLILGIKKFTIKKPKVRKIFAKVLKENNISFNLLKSIGFKKTINNNAIIDNLYYEIKNEIR